MIYFEILWFDWSNLRKMKIIYKHFFNKIWWKRRKCKLTRYAMLMEVFFLISYWMSKADIIWDPTKFELTFSEKNVYKFEVLFLSTKIFDNFWVKIKVYWPFCARWESEFKTAGTSSVWVNTIVIVSLFWTFH